MFNTRQRQRKDQRQQNKGISQRGALDIMLKKQQQSNAFTFDTKHREYPTLHQRPYLQNPTVALQLHPRAAGGACFSAIHGNFSAGVRLITKLRSAWHLMSRGCKVIAGKRP